MIIYSTKISKNYAFEMSSLHFVRSFKDGVTFFSYEIDSDFYKADHNPKFGAMLVILNFVIFEFRIYNVNHVDKE